MVFPSWLRPCAAMILMAGLLGLGSGCHHSSNDANGMVQVSGSVTFTRQPVQYDPVTGIPVTGPGGNVLGAGVVSPARGVVVNAYQLFADVGAQGNAIQAWRLVGSTVTDENGSYYITGRVNAGYPTFLEVASILEMGVGNLSIVKVIDPDPLLGLASPVPEPQRPIYAYRRDVLGNAVLNPVAPDATAPIGNAIASPSGDILLNFNLGASDTWVATRPDWYVPGSNPAYPLTSNQAQASPVENVALGSNALGILDSAYVFAAWFGDPTPSQTRGGVLDLHYRPGVTESPRRSYVVYDRSATPQAGTGTFEANGTTQKLAYFAALAGGPAVDDAWDPAVIYAMLGRNNLFGQDKTALFPTGPGNLESLAPDLAVVDGLGDAMAATLIATPWLTDTSQPTPLRPRDIRVIPANPGIGSPATLAALAWQLTLQAYQIQASPQTYATWSAAFAYNPSYLARFYTLIYPTTPLPGMVLHPVNQQVDIASIYAQLGRLFEPKAAGDPVDLHTLFTYESLTALLIPYQITFLPTPTGMTWNWIAADWDPVPITGQPTVLPLPATLPAFTLSMADAQQIPNPQIDNPVPASVFPNCSQGEVAYARLAATYDMALSLSIATVPALPAGVAVEVVVDPAIAPSLEPATLQPWTPYLVTAANPGPFAFSLLGNPTDVTNPVWHWVRFRLLDPLADPANLPPPVQVTVSLAATP